MMHIIIYGANSHTNIVCCRSKSNLKRHFSIINSLWLVTNNSKECVLHWTMCWL